jgi:hypothetical protein
MENRAYFEPILKEKINSIPDLLLPDLINFIDVFQKMFNLIEKEPVSEKSNQKNFMSFAGAWADLKDGDGFIEEIYDRRKNYFAGRNYR